jgi:MYXO-CTERM domain-containing protein
MARRLALPACIAAVLLLATEAQANFHLWVIDEVFSNADGSTQFIELFTAASMQNFLTGHFIATQQGAMALQTFDFPNVLVGETTNQHFLLATPGFKAVAGIDPDYEIPAGFIQVGTATTINFANVNAISLAGLPTDGVQSLDALGGTADNSPTNFAGEIGHVAPEPSGAALGLAALGALAVLSRRRASS